MTNATMTQVNEPTTGAQCRHHWLIEAPHGATSMGICKLCGAQKEFRNSASDILWEDEPLSELAHGRWGRSREFVAPRSEAGEDDMSMGPAAGSVSTRLV